jgi:hypothetical protein
MLSLRGNDAHNNVQFPFRARRFQRGGRGHRVSNSPATCFAVVRDKCDVVTPSGQMAFKLVVKRYVVKRVARQRKVAALESRARAKKELPNALQTRLAQRFYPTARSGG